MEMIAPWSSNRKVLDSLSSNPLTTTPSDPRDLTENICKKEF